MRNKRQTFDTELTVRPNFEAPLATGDQHFASGPATGAYDSRRPSRRGVPRLCCLIQLLSAAYEAAKAKDAEDALAEDTAAACCCYDPGCGGDQAPLAAERMKR